MLFRQLPNESRSCLSCAQSSTRPVLSLLDNARHPLRRSGLLKLLSQAALGVPLGFIDARRNRPLASLNLARCRPRCPGSPGALEDDFIVTSVPPALRWPHTACMCWRLRPCAVDRMAKRQPACRWLTRAACKCEGEIAFWRPTHKARRDTRRPLRHFECRSPTMTAISVCCERIDASRAVQCLPAKCRRWQGSHSDIAVQTKYSTPHQMSGVHGVRLVARATSGLETSQRAGCS